MDSRTQKRSRITVEQAIAQSCPLALDIRALPGLTLKQVLALSPDITTRKYQYWQQMGFLTPRSGDETSGIDYQKLCLMVRIAEGESMGLNERDAAEYAHEMVESDLTPIAPPIPVTGQTERDAMLQAAKSIRRAQSQLGGVLAYLNRALSADEERGV